MPEITTLIDIDAAPETVWTTLTDLESYPEWNPHLTRAEGTLGAGARLALWVSQSGRENHLDVTVTAWEPPRRLEWTGRFLAGALFEGTHAFELEPLDGGARTRLHNTERSRGILVPLVVKSDAREAYEAMNAALKARVEAGGAVSGDGTSAVTA